MDTAAPVGDYRKNIEFTFEFKGEFENINYIIKLGKIRDKLDELIIFAKEENENSINFGYYQETFSLEKLQNISKCFRFFDSIDETLESFKDIINDEKVSIQKDSDFLKFVMKMNKGGKGEEKVILRLPKNSSSNGKIIEYLINLMNEMKKEIKENREEIKKINQKLDKILQNNQYNTPLGNINIDSKILKKSEELKMITDRIKNNEILKNKNIKYRLLYRGTRDGMEPSIFHQKCKGNFPILSIVETTKGHKFGGYTEKFGKIHNNGTWIKDDKSFVFSIDHMKIYNHIKGADAIILNNNFGPSFYGCIYLKNKFKNNENYTFEKNCSNQFFSGFIHDYELNGGEKNFSLNEVEVFQIITE